MITKCHIFYLNQFLLGQPPTIFLFAILTLFGHILYVTFFFSVNHYSLTSISAHVPDEEL